MLEYAVRPYQTPNSQGKIIIPSTPSATTARATLTWGAKATMPDAQGGINVNCCSNELDELSRQGEVVRITQPDNSDNYVDVFRSNSLKLSQKTKHKDCQGPFDQYLSAEFAPLDGADIGADLAAEFGFGQTEDHCSTTWKLNNNTAAAR